MAHTRFQSHSRPLTCADAFNLAPSQPLQPHGGGQALVAVQAFGCQDVVGVDAGLGSDLTVRNVLLVVAGHGVSISAVQGNARGVGVV